MGEIAPPVRGLARELWRRPRTRFASCVLLLLAAGALVGPMVLPEHYARPGAAAFLAPCAAHPFGTDLNGRDLLYRVLSGARVSLLVGLAGALVSLGVGTLYAMVAGYAGGRIDAAMMRLVDVLYSVPRLIFILIFINTFDAALKDRLVELGFPALAGWSRLVILILALGLIEWLTMARIVRGQVLALKQAPFVTAARALGQSHPQIVLRHLLPNLAGVILVYLTLTIPAVILDESFLSFLGLGIQAPQASWGLLLSDGAQVINPVRSYWWLLLFPAVTMSLALLAFNFLGDGLRDLLDPRSRR